MSLANVLAKTIIDTSFSSADQLTIKSVITEDYNKSSVARNMLESWISAGNSIKFEHVPNKFQALTGTGIVQIDLSYLGSLSYISSTGEPIVHTPLSAITHELGHALTGRRDNWDLTKPDFQGDNVRFVNTIFGQLGLPQEISYIAQANPDYHIAGYHYTQGAPITGAITATPGLGFNLSTGSTSDLLIGGAAANRLLSGAGNDFLVGAGGNDYLNGGDGTDTADFYGNPLDFDIRQNSDGSWTVRNARGLKNEGTDTLKNIEKVYFGDGESFNLRKGGLTFQTDFALVIDTTGSMGSSIGKVKADADKLIDAAFRDGKADARIGIVGFKDTTNGEPSSVILKFTDQDDFAARKTAAKAALQSITVGGGGDLPETAYDGLKTALDGHLGQFRAGAGKIQIALFTDAAAKDTYLADQVTALAHNVGATITAHRSVAGLAGAVDTFDVAFPKSDNLNGEDIKPVPFDPTVDVPVAADATTSQVQIFTIFTGYSGADTSALSTISARNGGRLLDAPSGDDLVKALLFVINGGVKPKADINDDATSDLILQSSSSVYGWTVKNNIIDQATKIGATTYKVVGSGDFNNDGTTDLVLKSGSSIQTWTMRDGAVEAKTVLPKSGYRIVGTGDFDGDGTSDLLLQGTKALEVWTMKDGAFQSKTSIGSNSTKVVGTGDFNGDGTTDVLFQKGNTISSWTMQDGHMELANIISDHADGFVVKGTGDFDGNGTTDLLLQKKDTAAAWMIKDNHVEIAKTLWEHMGSNKFAATGDYNGDHTTDIAFQSGRTITALTVQNGAGAGTHTMSINATGVTARSV